MKVRADTVSITETYVKCCLNEIVVAKDYRSRDFSGPVSFGTLVVVTLGTILYDVLYE